MALRLRPAPLAAPGDGLASPAAPN